MEGLATFLFCSIGLFSILTISTAVHTITVNETFRDGDTIVSAGENFEMGFFSPGNSKNRYVGIWYKKIPNCTVVWVANRETPLIDTLGVLKVSNQGTLQLFNGANTIIWSSNSSGGSLRTINPVAQLLETGNLVIRDISSSDQENFIWQSFDYPGDNFLAGMKFGRDLVMGMVRNLTSWKSVDDPSPGEYTVWMDINGYPQVFKRKGSVLRTRLGPWNGLGFSDMRIYTYNDIYTEDFVYNQKEVFYRYQLIDSASVVSRMILTPDGDMQRVNWRNGTQGWTLYLNSIVDICAGYGLCGWNGICSIDNSPVCGCMEGFEPKLPEEWNPSNWSSGCQRRITLERGDRDGFLKVSSVKLPDTRDSLFNGTMTLGECEMACKNNCSCTAYANSDVRGGGCLQWFGDLIDVRHYPENQDLYIRVAASELYAQPGSNRKKGSKSIIRVTLSTSAGMVLLGLLATAYAWRIKKKKSHLKREGRLGLDPDKGYTNASKKEDVEVPLFSLSKIAKATNNFSINNILGEGGFGPVYKGVLEEGQEIAVKRLSKTSSQGFDEFKNEVSSVAKLQHRNLVKLLGCCIQEDEMMLIYEYLHNKSLDSFIFDGTKKSLLDWSQRFHIINGIARGLLYLHQDSRLRIIHRDLKAGNILLDFDMNPKISDFGLARRFRGYETGDKTNKVVGTYGYISPEYACNGCFSIKSDVFSFGVLVLEIVSGKRNREFSHLNQYDNLLGHAWRLYEESRCLELIDEHLSESCKIAEVLRSIHVGLLCVQQRAEDRPSMSSVVLMLGGERALPPSKQPGFVAERNCKPVPHSVNEVTITLLDAR